MSPIEGGLRKCWTPKLEAKFQFYLMGPAMSGPDSFARQHVIMSLRDALKYDRRTREGKRAEAATQLRIATASDEELREIASICSYLDGCVGEECLADLREFQAELWRRNEILKLPGELWR